MSIEKTALPALALSRHELDRDYLSRARPDLLDELWGDPSTRVLVLWNGRALLAAGPVVRLELVPPDAVPRYQLRLYLGRSLAATTHSLAIAAAVIDDETAVRLAPDAARWGSLRELGGLLADGDTGFFTTALAMANWHSAHAFSPRSGAATAAGQGGWVLKGASDENEMFPRTDAAIIVGVIDENDRILLGSNAAWAENRFSLLAGFVEPGESLETAVIREVFEESGIRVIDPVYLGSQPWPFPASLMIGFTARVDPHQISTLTPDGSEILELRWFSRDDLTASLGEIHLPGRTSIARAILEHWFGGPIHDVTEW